MVSMSLKLASKSNFNRNSMYFYLTGYERKSRSGDSMPFRDMFVSQSRVPVVNTEGKALWYQEYWDTYIRPTLSDTATLFL